MLTCEYEDRTFQTYISTNKHKALHLKFEYKTF